MHHPVGCGLRRKRGSEYQFQTLEPRMLLAAATSFVAPSFVAPSFVTPNLASAAIADGLQPVDWKGNHTFAEPGQWVATLNRKNTAARSQLRQINKVLAGDGIRAVRRLEGNNLFLIRGDNLPIDQVRSDLSAVAGFQNVEPDLAQWSQGTTTTTPNDPSFSQQWALNQSSAVNINAQNAWGISTGSSNVVVAVLDTGVDLTHPDLAANIWTNPGETAADGVDNDGDGYVDDVHGYDFVNWDADPSDDNGHGTMVAGAIAEAGNNGVGGTGVAWHTSILPIKTIAANGAGLISSVVAGMNYIVELKTHDGVNIRVVNYSSTGSYSASLETAIQNLDANGILLVAAAGNGGNSLDATPCYPAALPEENIISVAATDSSDNLASFSNYGPTTVDLGAPGVSVYTTAMGDSYGSMTGTSIAAPMVSGVAALAFAANPNATVAQVKAAILNGADPIPALAGKTISGGRLDAFNTLQQITGAVGIGLTGSYYNSTTLTGTAALSRIDQTVNFNWDTGSPASIISNDNFSVQWTGKVQPQYSQTYTFTSQADDGVKVIVNGQTVINRWSNHPAMGDVNGDGVVNALDFARLASAFGASGAAAAPYDLNGDGTINAADFAILSANYGKTVAPLTDSGSITLLAGQKYAITVDYYDSTGPASMKLLWSSSSQPQQIIPKSALYPS